MSPSRLWPESECGTYTCHPQSVQIHVLAVCVSPAQRPNPRGPVVVLSCAIPCCPRRCVLLLLVLPCSNRQKTGASETFSLPCLALPSLAPALARRLREYIKIGPAPRTFWKTHQTFAPLPATHCSCTTSIHSLHRQRPSASTPAHPLRSRQKCLSRIRSSTTSLSSTRRSVSSLQSVEWWKTDGFVTFCSSPSTPLSSTSRSKPVLPRSMSLAVLGTFLSLSPLHLCLYLSIYLCSTFLSLGRLSMRAPFRPIPRCYRHLFPRPHV